jgi:tol-pal system protein YbgF
MNRKLYAPFAVLASGLLLSGCLKTRSQIHDDDEGPGRPVPAQVTEVKGQYALDEIKSEMTRLNGRVEDLERTQRQSDQNSKNDKSKEEIKALENRIIELEKAQAEMIELLKKMEGQAQANRDPSDLLAKGRQAMEEKNYDSAIDQLSAYLKSPKAKAQEEAFFLRGEAYYETKQYKKAIVDFSKFPEKFTKSKRMPDALLRIGQSFDALGMKDDAKGFYQELVEKFPKSSEAKTARKRLK